MKGYETKHRPETFSISWQFCSLHLELLPAGNAGSTACSLQKALLQSRIRSPLLTPSLLHFGQYPHNLWRRKTRCFPKQLSRCQRRNTLTHCSALLALPPRGHREGALPPSPLRAERRTGQISKAQGRFRVILLQIYSSAAAGLWVLSVHPQFSCRTQLQHIFLRRSSTPM